MEFSDNAYLKLSQRFPDLVSAVTGFYDLSEELTAEDDTLSVGVFELSIGPEVFFLPIISKNSVIQPLDSVVNAETNLFFPASPAYIRTLLDTPTNSYGQNMRLPTSATKNPNLYKLVVPPRTGKMPYASASKAMELLALAPTMYKQALLEELKKDETFASNLDSVFPLADLAETLTAAAKATQALAAKTAPNTTVQILTDGSGDLTDDEIQAIIQNGYAIRGTPAATRVAVPVENFSVDGAYQRTPAASMRDGRCYTIAMQDGSSRVVLGLKQHPVAVTGTSTRLMSGDLTAFATLMLTDGTYLTTDYVVSKPDSESLVEGLSRLIEFSPSYGADEVQAGTFIAVISHTGQLVFLGSVLRQTGGSDFVVSALGSEGKTQSMSVLHSLTDAKRVSPDAFVIPAGFMVVELKPNFDEVARSVNQVQDMSRLRGQEALQQVNVLRSNGVNGFLYNGMQIDSAPLLIQRLVVEEEIDPLVAQSFMKTASENGVVQFYMSKKADMDIATDFNESRTAFPQADVSNVFPDGEGTPTGFVNTLKQALPLQDPELVNATIIAELLHAPSLKQYVDNYAPDLRLSIDRLGRLLFVTRLKISQLFTGENGVKLLTTVNVMKSVYASLGSLYMSLVRLPDDRDPTFNEDSYQ